MNYELHLTVEPIESTLDAFKAFSHGWKFSCFDEDEVDGIEGKWFLTRHTQTWTDALGHLTDMANTLRAHGYEVTRGKIELVMFDTKGGDLL